ncbi:MAG: O-antigen ligase family protein, partial [Solirubrobacteraceae bacterium]
MPRSLPSSPVTLPMLVALVVFVTWSATEAGLPLAHWYPGTLFLLGLLAATAFVLPARGRDLPRATKVAGIFLLAFTAWSFASILWAEAQSDAWDGANRTLLYLVVFALFALWPQDETGATIVLCAWVLAIAGIALVQLLVLTAADDPSGAFIADRLAEPAGYPNAQAATLMMAFFPAVVLAGRRELPWWSRGVFAAAAVILADVALLSQSRGLIYAFPILVVALFVFLPGRARSFGVLLVVGGAVTATAPGVLDVGRRLRDGETAAAAMSGAARPIVLASLLVAAVVTAVARFDRIRRLPVAAEQRIARGVGALGLAGALAGVVVALAIAGNPIDVVRDGWRSFKQKDNPVTAANTSSRLGSGLGSNRYDFYRVALDNFADRQMVGKGGDNFERDYLVRGRSLETPRYPHSLELRTLSELGIVGALLLLGVVAGVCAGALTAMRRGPPLGRAVAGGAAMVFAYWLVHGSVDWFFEFAGLGAPAFAMAGLACALIPRPGAAEAEAAAAHPPALVHGWAVPAGVAAVLVAGVSLV